MHTHTSACLWFIVMGKHGVHGTWAPLDLTVMVM